LIYSIISKWLEPNEINIAFTCITEVTTILNIFGNSIFNYLYSITVSYSRNFTLLVAAGLAIVPLILNCLLYGVTKTIHEQQIAQRITERNATLIPDHIPMMMISNATSVPVLASTAKEVRRNRRN
jgi:hypothetical protein